MLAEALEVARILMYGEADDALEKGEYVILSLYSFFKFEVPVPKGMRQEVKTA